jgi:hypothetical protein
VLVRGRREAALAFHASPPASSLEPRPLTPLPLPLPQAHGSAPRVPSRRGSIVGPAAAELPATTVPVAGATARLHIDVPAPPVRASLASDVDALVRQLASHDAEVGVAVYCLPSVAATKERLASLSLALAALGPEPAPAAVAAVLSDLAHLTPQDYVAQSPTIDGEDSPMQRSQNLVIQGAAAGDDGNDDDSLRSVEVPAVIDAALCDAQVLAAWYAARTREIAARTGLIGRSAALAAAALPRVIRPWIAARIANAASADAGRRAFSWAPSASAASDLPSKPGSSSNDTRAQADSPFLQLALLAVDTADLSNAQAFAASTDGGVMRSILLAQWENMTVAERVSLTLANADADNIADVIRTRVLSLGAPASAASATDVTPRPIPSLALSASAPSGPTSAAAGAFTAASPRLGAATGVRGLGTSLELQLGPHLAAAVAARRRADDVLSLALRHVLRQVAERTQTTHGASISPDNAHLASIKDDHAASLQALRIARAVVAASDPTLPRGQVAQA